jgi:putative hydrolase of the HAD superfamily
MVSRDFDPHHIRWIAFDAVGTLIRPSPSVGVIYQRVGARHGSRLGVDAVTRRFRDVFARLGESTELACGCLESDDHLHTCDTRERLRWQRIVRSVLDDVQDSDACFEELFAHFRQPDAWICFPEVGPALRRLREAGYRLAIASNFDRRLHSVMDGTSELSAIELRLISAEIKHRKPSERFFAALARATGAAPSEILFVGDDPAIDVAAAQAAGFWALQIDRGNASDKNPALRSLDDLVARLLAPA